MKPFADCDFVVTFYGESPESILIRGWDRVLAYIDYQLGAEGDGWSSRNPDECTLHDHDEWSRLEWCAEGEEDYRHSFSKAEFAYCVGLSIVRITEPLAAMFDKEINEALAAELEGKS